ncbi:DNA gyrase subunit A [Streptomyces sp. NPDC048506]|uniref:DNA gyrase subunit A n=1 Tax=Streptomyces sp. NPDC048506 TaxID=3155028 RepID=UPI00341A5055
MSTNNEHVAERLGILNAMMRAIEARTAVLDAISAAASFGEARDGVMHLLDVTEIDAYAILEMPLMRLTVYNRARIAEEIEQLTAQT